MQIYKTLTRIFIDSIELEESICFYEKLFGVKCALRFKYSEKALELAMVGSVLIVSGCQDSLKPFTETKITFIFRILHKTRLNYFGIPKICSNRKKYACKTS